MPCVGAWCIAQRIKIPMIAGGNHTVISYQSPAPPRSKRAVDNRPYGEVGDCAATHRQKLAGISRLRQEGLLFEECHGNGAGAYVGADGAADGADGKRMGVVFPEGGAVDNILLQQLVVQAGVAQSQRPGKVDARGGPNLLDEKIVAVFGAFCLAEYDDFSVFYSNNRFYGQYAAHKCNAF